MIAHDKNKRIQSVEVGFRILQVLAEKRGPMSLNELANATGLFKSQLYRYLNSFVYLGVLIRENEENPRWSLGPELITLGSAALEGLQLSKLANPYLIELKDKLNETVALSIWREQGPFFIRWESSNKFVNIGINTGSYVPLYTATGKIFRAFLPETVTELLYQKEVAAGNIDPGEYDADIEQIKKQHYALTRGSLITGIVTVSTPIFFPSAKLAGALSIVGVWGELDASPDSKTVLELLKTGREISYRLGYMEPV